MQAVLRESTFGLMVNYLSKGKLLPYPEERADFVVPAQFLRSGTPSIQANGKSLATDEKSSTKPKMASSHASQKTLTPNSTLSPDQTRAPTPLRPAHDRRESSATLSPDAHAQHVIDAVLAAEESVKPEAVEEGVDHNLVGWYDEHDPENPQNWSNGRKALVMATTCLLTFSVYIGSAIYTPSIPGVMEEFGVSQTKATLGLTLYVLFYGIGPMVLSPVSEIPSVGRLSVYMVSLFIFVIVQIPSALAPNWSTLMAMRAIAGFACSPALSTGGATLSDTFKPLTQPYVVALWAAGAVLGPTLGPIAGGFAAMNKGWRWPLYELLFLGLFCLIVLFFTFPETSADTILLRRARRLRKLTGNENLKSKGEIEQEQMSTTKVMVTAMWRPFLLLTEPVVFTVDLYIALIYSIFYLDFEVFPLIFGGIYNFNLGEQGLPFVGFVVAMLPTLAGYFYYQKYFFIAKVHRTGQLVPEQRLKVALFGSFIIPVAIFWLGWSARASVHWIVPIIGAALLLPGCYLVFQGAIVYLPLSYQKYAASVLASNAMARGATAAVFPLFGRALFEHLTIGGGSSLLAGLSILMIPPLFALYHYGARLRSYSKYATS